MFIQILCGEWGAGGVKTSPFLLIKARGGGGGGEVKTRPFLLVKARGGGGGEERSRDKTSSARKSGCLAHYTRSVTDFNYTSSSLVF